MSAIEVISPDKRLSKVAGYWAPESIANLNESKIKLVKFKGQFVWHKHDKGDCLFYVIDGNLKIELRDKVLELHPGDLVIIPQGVEHRPATENTASLMLVEP